MTDNEVLPTYDSVVRDMPRIMADLRAAEEAKLAEPADSTQIIHRVDAEPVGGEPR